MGKITLEFIARSNWDTLKFQVRYLMLVLAKIVFLYRILQNSLTKSYIKGNARSYRDMFQFQVKCFFHRILQNNSTRSYFKGNAISYQDMFKFQIRSLMLILARS